jgi:glyoxylase-like metal-dependent hydrolase (beta-lactamase superfamily II)
MILPRVDIISIGTLSRNRLWNEPAAVRTPHATTSLVRARGDKLILIDPGLPPPAVAARLNERTGLDPSKVGVIFLTNFRQAHRGGLDAFPKATVFMHELEIDSARKHVERMLDEAPAEDLDRKHYEKELGLLTDRIKPAEDKLADGVDLFPLFGYTPGTCGLLVAASTVTTVIAGDAVPTLDHFLAGQVLPDSHDIKAAQEALAEVYEIADIIVPGHDNAFVNPRTMGM